MAFFDRDVDFTPEALTNYGFTLVEPCPDGAFCEIQILNYAFEPTQPDSLYPDVGLVIVEAIGDAVAAHGDLNPFAEPQAIEIFEINATFKLLGTNKTLAICQYSPVEDDVVFQTEPIIVP